MSGDSARLGAVFFVPRQGEAEHVSADGLAEKAGLDVEARRWAGLGGCRWWSEAISPDHRVLFITFFASSLIELMTDEAVPVERDGAADVARSFGRACVALDAPAAFVLTHRDQAASDRALRIAVEAEWTLYAGDGDALLREYLGLTWLGAALTVEGDTLTGRDVLPCGDGRLVFAGQGDGRWF